MIVGFKITYSGRGAMAVVRKRMPAILKGAYKSCLIKWHREFRPKHFTPAGALEYGYAKRGAAYMRKKASEKHHQRPLTWSGESESQSRRNYGITATSKGGRLTMRIPKLNYKNRHMNPAIDMRAEMETVSPREQKELVAFFRQIVQAGLARITDKITVNIAEIGAGPQAQGMGFLERLYAEEFSDYMIA